MGLNVAWILGVACPALFPAEPDVLARWVLIPANHEADQVLPEDGDWALPCVDPTFLGKVDLSPHIMQPLVVDFGETLKMNRIELRVLDREPGTKPVGFSSIELQAR